MMRQATLLLALALGQAYLAPRQARGGLAPLRMVTDVTTLYGPSGGRASPAVVAEKAAEVVEVVEPAAVAPVIVGDAPAPAAEEPAAAAPAPAPAAVEKPATTTTAKYAPPMPEAGAAPAQRGPGDLRFKRRSEQKYSELSGFLGVVPELPRPAVLDGSHAGDYGFDPAGFVTDNAELYTQMEAEVRHCRLAMLCAAGWPLAELWGTDFFDGAFLADGGRAPSVLNGGLLDFPPLPGLAVLAFFAAYGARELELIGTLKSQTLYGNVHKKDLEALGDEWPWGVAGDEDFDPLGLYGLLGNDAVGRFAMRELELNHGRVAMLAVLGYVMIEATTHVPVVALTPFLFGKWFW